jgi:hypothetical protein
MVASSGPGFEALGGLENVREHADVADGVQEDSLAAEHPVRGKLDLGRVRQGLIPVLAVIGRPSQITLDLS